MKENIRLLALFIFLLCSFYSSLLKNSLRHVTEAITCSTKVEEVLLHKFNNPTHLDEAMTKPGKQSMLICTGLKT